MIDPRHLGFRLARRAAGLHAQYHQATLEGVGHLPRGGALLVGNHGLLGLDTPPFFYLLHAQTGRVPVGLADRKLFGGTPIRQILARLGGVPGTPENARALLEQGELVVCYPGGSRETFKSPEQAYQLQWEQRVGFARLAAACNAPVVPFAGAGVDETFFNFGHLQSLRARLGRYAAPLTLGLGPLPLPVPLRFTLGPPLRCAADEPPAQFKLRVQTAVEAMLTRLACRPGSAHAGEVAPA
jgi:1-acyl-sn-glycerol-3-phosphate acyltransferase